MDDNTQNMTMQYDHGQQTRGALDIPSTFTLDTLVTKVFINRQLIYNYPDQLLKEAGVMAIEHSATTWVARVT